MIVRRVWAREFRSYAEMDVTLPAGCVAILGPNGAGKSSILLAIDAALFGGRDLAHYHRRDGGGEMEVGVVVEHRGDEYRVRRGHSASGRGKTFLTVERLDDDGGGWHVVTRETAAQTQEWMQMALGLNRVTLRASAVLMQGDGAAFTEAQPRERKQVLADILGLGVYDRLRDAAQTERVALSGQVERCGALIEACEQELERLMVVTVTRDDALSGVADVEQRIAEMEQQIAEDQVRAAEWKGRAALLRKLDEQARGMIRDAAEKREQVKRRVEAIEAGNRAAARLALVGPVAAQVESLEQAVERAGEWRERTRERADVVRRMMAEEQSAAKARGELGRLIERTTQVKDHDDERCELCGQALGVEAKQQTVEKLVEQQAVWQETLSAAEDAAGGLRDGVAALDVEIERLTEPQPGIEDELRLARSARDEVGEQKAAVAVGQRAADEIRELEQVIAHLDEQCEAVLTEASALDTGEAEDGGMAERQARLVELRAERAKATQLAARVEMVEQQRADAVVRMDTLTADRAVAVEAVETLTRLEHAFGRDGVPALIVESAAIPLIEQDANRILTELGADMQVELRTQRALKTDKRVADALDIVVATTSGEGPYEDFSGGERTRLNLALRIALARLLAHRRGAEVRLLALDEPEHLDEAGMLALAGVLAGLTDEFETVLLVSHHPILADAFDAALVVERTEDGSRILAGAAA